LPILKRGDRFFLFFYKLSLFIGKWEHFSESRQQCVADICQEPGKKAENWVFLGVLLQHSIMYEGLYSALPTTPC
jgi:hypothetical protein